MNDNLITGEHERQERATIKGCTLGVGCEEAGICYAAANNKPDECGAPMVDALAVPVDITAELVQNANRQLEAQIEAAVRAAFDGGSDFVREVAGTVDPSEPGFTTFKVNAGPWPIDQETPPGCVRYSRPANWPAIAANVSIANYRK